MLLRPPYLPISSFAQSIFNLYEMFPYNRAHPSKVKRGETYLSILQHFYEPEVVSELLGICERDGLNCNVKVAVYWLVKGLVQAKLNPTLLIPILKDYKYETKELSAQLLEEVKVMHPRIRYLLGKLSGISNSELILYKREYWMKNGFTVLFAQMIMNPSTGGVL